MISTWKALETEKQFQDAIEKSHQKPVVFFKHSVTCGISARSKYMLEEGWDFQDSEIDFHYLDLLSYRPISNQIAEKFNVRHQSPQVIVVKGGKSIYDMSHHRISVSSLRTALVSNLEK